MKMGKCPVCDGWGNREPRYPQDVEGSTMMVSCNACHGSGISIVEMSSDEIADLQRQMPPPPEEQSDSERGS